MRRKEIEHYKQKETVNMDSLSSSKPIFKTSAIRNSKPKIRNQKHANRADITLIHIYIHTWPHTQKNSDTQSHGQTTISTRDTTEREIARGKGVKREGEKLGGTIQYYNLKT